MGPLLLFLTTLIWGTAFVAQKVGGDVLGPFAVTCFRNVLGGAFLLGCVAVRRRFAAVPALPARPAVVAGIWCGLPLFAAMAAQQIGIASTTPGVSAFLTANYVLLVPLLGAAVSRKLPGASVWGGAAAALCGTALICFGGAETVGLRLGPGEAWTILCAFLFAVQMLVVDRFARGCDVLVMSATQLLTCAVCGLPFLFCESESAKILAAPAGDWIGPLLYLGVMSSGIAYTLQNFGQAKTPAALAAIILSLESVVGALAGYLFRGDVLTASQFGGCALVFGASVATSVLAARRTAS